MSIPFIWNQEYVDAEYQKWKLDPKSVSSDWQFFFYGFEYGKENTKDSQPCEEALLQSRVDGLIYRYRALGHIKSCVNPLEENGKNSGSLWNLSEFELSEEHLPKSFYIREFSDVGKITLKEILNSLEQTYCQAIGVEYMHIQRPEERFWLQEKMEKRKNCPNFNPEQKIRILNKLYQAGIFEQYLHKKYVGQKRFSLEGAESLIVMLDEAIHRLSELGCEEIILGMAHRGRLNVLVNTLWKLYEEIFCEFEDNYDPVTVTGNSDVRYHKGYMSDMKLHTGKHIRLFLAPNPSHLESVDPVVQGIARARQFYKRDEEREKVVPILIHGDAAFSGQGIVSEILNLSQLKGYRTGGTIHIIVNNQIGFTTLPEDSRSTTYSTDVAKMLMVPIFHVNADEPESVAYIMHLASDYRIKFKKDVFIDLLCYRRYGHNEGDEPLFTQPSLYEKIRKRLPIYEKYAKKLISEKVIVESKVTEIQNSIELCMEEGFKAAHLQIHQVPEEIYYENWKNFEKNYNFEKVDTKIDATEIISLARQLNHFPNNFSLHPKLKRILDKRLEAVEKKEGIDWPSAEALAFASLVKQGIPVRLSGQDSGRGTFSQRHCTIYDFKTGEKYIPLQNIDIHQAYFSIFDSALSEAAVLGFEYGYSLVEPKQLVIWEAQFGDFANGAQVIIDQYIASAETKWKKSSGLIMLLPHGYEGQGPEHSSARIERFLELCALNNIQVCNLTTPAQYFHVLRRQVLRNFCKPLIIFTPKSLLRHPSATSTLDDFSQGCFREVKKDPKNITSPKRILFCTGKIYYELLEKREKDDCTIIRIEQIYPFPEDQIKEFVSLYPKDADCFWVQEEPKNMGCWLFIEEKLRKTLGKTVGYIGRSEAASPATGIFKIHQQEQQKIVMNALES